jgi:hypothetical protein
MRTLSVQLQPDRLGTRPADHLVEALRSFVSAAAGGAVAEDRGDDDGRYINFTFGVSDHVAAWSRLRAMYDDGPVGRDLGATTIVVCEGPDGWNDYLLLHHFDQTVAIDDIRSR